jgi:hypothetical protein
MGSIRRLLAPRRLQQACCHTPKVVRPFWAIASKLVKELRRPAFNEILSGWGFGAAIGNQLIQWARPR